MIAIGDSQVIWYGLHQKLAERLVQHGVTEDPRERGRVLRQLGGLLEFPGSEAFQTFGPFGVGDCFLCPGDSSGTAPASPENLVA